MTVIMLLTAKWFCMLRANLRHQRGLAVLMTVVTLTALSSMALAGLLFQAQALQAQQHRQWLLLKQRNEQQFLRQQAYYAQLEKE